MGFILLILSAACEAGWNIFLKKSSGFSHWQMNLPGVALLLTGIFSFKRSLSSMPLGVAIVIWTGLQLVLTIALDFLIFHAKVDWKVAVSLSISILAILVLSYLSNQSQNV